MTRRLAAVVFAACALVASSASASRVGVGPIRGPGGEAVRDSLEDALRRSGHEVIERSALESAGARLRPESIGADFVVGGRVRRAGAAWSADLTVERADARGERRVRMRGSEPDQLAERVVSHLESRVRGFEPTAAAPAAEPAPAQEPAPEPEVAPEPVAAADPPEPRDVPPAPAPARTESSGRYRLVRPPQRSADDPLGFRTRNALELETSAGVLSRSLTFRDDLFSSVRGYELAGAPALVLRGRLFPFARTEVPVLRDLGVEAESEYDFVADSRRPDGQAYPTSSSAWSVGLTYRLPIGRHALLGSFGYGVHSFLIDPGGPATPTNDPRPELPRVRYETLRTGLGLRLAPVAGLVLHLRGSYLAVLDAGGIESDVWFPHARVTAIDAMAGVGYRLTPGLELRAAVQYRRYGFDLRPERGDAYIVGGAADQYWLYTIGVAVMR